MRRRTVSGSVTLSNAFIGIAAVWEIAAPFVLGYSSQTAPMANDVVVGILIAVVASARGFGLYSLSWMGWLFVAFGIWLVASPFLLTYAGTPMVNDLVVGIALVILGTWNALASRSIAD